jgi:hypothetical protein
MPRPTLIGLISASPPSPTNSPADRFGMYSGVYKHLGHPVILGYDDTGVVNAFLPVNAKARDYMIAAPFEHEGSIVGENHELFFYLNEKSLIANGWDEVAAAITAEPLYDFVRAGVLNSGPNGYQIARFLGHYAPKYAANAASAGRPCAFDPQAAQKEITDMQDLALELAQVRPEWVAKRPSSVYVVTIAPNSPSPAMN